MADENECADAALGERVCSVLNDIPGVSQVYRYLGDVQREKVEAVASALGDLVPDSFIEEWVRGMAESTVSLLSFIQQLGERVTRPAFDQDWWASQYATSFGLSLLLLGFLLVWITGRFAASGSSFTAMDLLRQSGWRLVFVVPLISLGPLLLLELQVASAELARSFADEGTEHAASAVERLMDLIVEKAGDWGVFGGTVLALLLFLCILCLGLVTLIEMTVAQWGLHLAGLLVPLVLVAWVYPPWSGALRRLAGLIGGLMLLPAFIYFFFHTFWSALDSMLGDHPDDDGLTVLLFLLVGLLMIDAFPMVAMWLMSLAMPSGAGMDPDLRGTVSHPSGGEMVAGAAERFEERASRIGGSGIAAEPGGGSDDDGQENSSGASEAAAAAGAAAGGGVGAAVSVAKQANDGDDGDDGNNGADPGGSSSGPSPGAVDPGRPGIPMDSGGARDEDMPADQDDASGSRVDADRRDQT
ncbi:hypothetical protein [Streptomyces profundus]|uniref:hypothetical protein n=1 Tax=Streptomyces profundus TaxID=2867410 RepID=UPI001D160C64|nr:hypothetical protein [Streptomyces sp. MA3_2.13]UED84725.1 hypothetical protein K4G22_11335 [Streptomyces sp. MA3_2.13]